jgi:hypothetical protein
VSSLPYEGDLLGPVGRRWWADATKVMAERGYLSPAWAFELEQAAWWWERWHGLADRLIAAEDPADKNLSVRVADASTHYSARSAKLGLTPADAGKVSIPPRTDEQDEELVRLLGFDSARRS